MKIIASNKQLADLGIPYDISGLDCEVVKDFSDGWIMISVKIDDIPEFNNFTSDTCINFDVTIDCIESRDNEIIK